MERRFIESPYFPVAEISEASRVEKGPGRPPHWEMVFWWTRKPLISARAIIAGCLLPENTNPRNFLKSIGVEIKGRKLDGHLSFKGAPHRNNPKIRFDSSVRLLDPFAGFGSIPLEALRLGLSATAVELLPTAYVFLKAVLEYPAKYGKRLVKDVEKWGNWVIERLKEDPLIKELYDEDVAVYIGSWEIKCPHCGRWTPLVGNWWLARVKAGNGYKRLAWMEPVIEGENIKIHVVDLNKILGDRAVEKASVSGSRVVADGREFRVPESNIEARREKALCLFCHQPIMKIDPQTGKHYTDTKDLPQEVKDRLEGYVKFALNLYNKWIGKEESLPEWLDDLPARQRLLVKVKVTPRDLKFEPCTQEDQQKLEKARKEVEKMLELNNPDIPKEIIANYELRSIWVLAYGFDKFYKLFNPRQLLALVKLVNLIREASKKIEEEIKEEQSLEEAFKYAEAITVYLAITLCKHIDYNTIVNLWNPGSWSWNKVAHSLSMRGIAMQWNWCEIVPFIGLPLSYRGSQENTIKALSYLTFVLSPRSPEANVLLDDATVMNKLGNDRFNLIVTDPPYYDDVPYAELSDFFYVWLKRALSDAQHDRLKPKFLSDAFFEKIGNAWVEVSTQWERYALNEVSLNPPRLGLNSGYEDGVGHFQNLLSSSFIAAASRLKENGMLVTYYAHTDPDAWKALLKAGWEAAELSVSNAFPLTTEFALSVVRRGKLSMDTSIVVVWRKSCQGAIEASQLYNQMVEESARRARELMEAGWIGRDLIIGTLAAALSVATKYKEVKVMGKIDVSTLVDKYVYPAAYLGLARAYARKAELKDGIKSPDAMFYMLIKATLAGAKSKILDSTDIRILSIGTSLNVHDAISMRLLLPSKKGAGARVAKAKSMMLAEPKSASRNAVAELLELRGIGLENPKIRCTVDMLHLLEYYALVYPRGEFARKINELRSDHPALVEEALAMARIFSKVLPDEDPEKALCNRILQPEERF